MSDEVKVSVIVETDVDEKVKIAEAKRNKIVRDWARTERTIDQQIARLNLRVNATINTIRVVYRAFGNSLTPIQDALVNAILTTLAAALSIHRTLEAATLGVAGVITIGLSVTSVSLSLVAIQAATEGMNESKAAVDRAQAAIDSLQVTANVFGVG